jgi:hypothetical protein
VPTVELPVPASSRAGSDDDVALRDAAAIAERVRADETAADEARGRYLAEPLAPMIAPTAIARLLEPGERLLIARSRVLIELPLEEAGEDRQIMGDLYLTDRRLLVVDHRVLEAVGLAGIAEIGVVGDRTMQVSTSTGRGIAIDLERPRLFRVQIQAARERLEPATGDRPQAESR